MTSTNGFPDIKFIESGSTGLDSLLDFCLDLSEGVDSLDSDEMLDSLNKSWVLSILCQSFWGK